MLLLLLLLLSLLSKLQQTFRRHQNITVGSVTTRRGAALALTKANVMDINKSMLSNSVNAGSYTAKSISITTNSGVVHGTSSNSNIATVGGASVVIVNVIAMDVWPSSWCVVVLVAVVVVVVVDVVVSVVSVVVVSVSVVVVVVVTVAVEYAMVCCLYAVMASSVRLCGSVFMTGCLPDVTGT